jgi:excisionase family DNA binding protein
MSLTIDLPEELVERIAERAAELLADRESPASHWLTVLEAAEYLRCPKSRIYSLVSARRIPHVKDGSRTLFARSELDTWLRDGGGKRP